MFSASQLAHRKKNEIIINDYKRDAFHISMSHLFSIADIIPQNCFLWNRLIESNNTLFSLVNNKDNKIN